MDIGWITNPESGVLRPFDVKIITPDGDVIVDPGDLEVNITDPID